METTQSHGSHSLAPREWEIAIVDDNLIGTRHEHIARAKDLFRAMAQANLRKQWVAPATNNFADDEELLALAAWLYRTSIPR